MLTTPQIYLEAIAAVVLVVMAGVISAFIAVGVTEDRGVAVSASCAMMALTAAILAARLWRRTRSVAAETAGGGSGQSAQD